MSGNTHRKAHCLGDVFQHAMRLRPDGLYRAVERIPVKVALVCDNGIKITLILAQRGTPSFGELRVGELQRFLDVLIDVIEVIAVL